MNNLLIVAAGTNSRLNLNIPKALVKIDGIENVTNTILKCKNLFNSIFVVTNNRLSDKWDDYFSKLREDYPLLSNITEIKIDSGLGDGHATLEAIKSSEFEKNKVGNGLCVCWGDVYLESSEIIHELWENHKMVHDKENIDGLVPCVKEKNPYVVFDTNGEDNIKNVRFSKLGEINEEEIGYHDQSIFLFKNEKKLKKDLLKIHNIYFKENEYKTINKEMSLLSVFKCSEIKDSINKAYETKYPTKTFNTIEELDEITNLLV